MQWFLLFVKVLFVKVLFVKVCVLQQQVPLPLPCFNFAQITIPSLTLKLFKRLGNFKLHNNLVIE